MQQKKNQVHYHSPATYHKTFATTCNRPNNPETPIGATANVTGVTSPEKYITSIFETLSLLPSIVKQDIRKFHALFTR